MQLVIDIADDIYEDSRKYMSWEWRIVMAIRNAIVNGTPLPKGHGRLIDADKFAMKFNSTINSKVNGEYVAPTAIEADKEVE